jgi:hypothetical protein
MAMSGGEVVGVVAAADGRQLLIVGYPASERRRRRAVQFRRDARGWYELNDAIVRTVYLAVFRAGWPDRDEAWMRRFVGTTSLRKLRAAVVAHFEAYPHRRML